MSNPRAEAPPGKTRLRRSALPLCLPLWRNLLTAAGALSAPCGRSGRAQGTVRGRAETRSGAGPLMDAARPRELLPTSLCAFSSRQILQEYADAAKTGLPAPQRDRAPEPLGRIRRENFPQANNASTLRFWKIQINRDIMTTLAYRTIATRGFALRDGAIPPLWPNPGRRPPLWI